MRFDLWGYLWPLKEKSVCTAIFGYKILKSSLSHSPKHSEKAHKITFPCSICPDHDIEITEIKIFQRANGLKAAY